MEVKKRIPFKVVHSTQSYSSKEGLETEITDDKVIIKITKQFSTPGYSMKVDEITKKDEDYIVDLSIIPPKVDAILMQVITYKTIVIEIDKKDIGEFKEIKIK